MGLFDRFTGSKYPALDPSNPQARVISSYATQLEELMAQVGGGIEVVSSGDVLYAFIGSPPKNFGLAWFDAEGPHNLKKLAEAHGLGYNTVAQMTDRLGAAYAEHSEAPRLSFQIGKKSITVIDSDALALSVSEVLTDV